MEIVTAKENSTLNEQQNLKIRMYLNRNNNKKNINNEQNLRQN